jgi:hypothetical protein
MDILPLPPLTGAVVLGERLRGFGKEARFAMDLPVDGRQSETALMVQRGVCRLLRAAGFATLTQM